MKVFFVAEIGRHTLTLNGNHPFSGMTLCFSIDIADVAAPQSASSIRVDY